MSALSRPRVLARLTAALRPFLEAQDLDSRRPTRGAFVRPEWGLDDPSHTGTALLLAGGAWLALLGPARTRGESVHRVELAASYLLRAQRPSGLIDLKSCNFDSAPDTAFVVQLACAVLEQTAATPALAATREHLALFVRRAAPGLARGGFHTPNHRWVIASALAWSGTLLPEARHDDAVRAYLAEGIDQDADGAYQERSAAVYDAVTNRSLWLLHRHARWRPALPAIRRNLALDLSLMNPDGTIDSSASRRQDRAWRIAPASLAQAAWLAGSPTLAARFWGDGTEASAADCVWMLHALATAPSMETPLPAALPPVARSFPRLGLARWRRGRVSLSAFRDELRVARGMFGEVELLALGAAQAYFGAGAFRADTLSFAGTTATLRSNGTRNPRRPGYELPLGRPVPIEAWEQACASRPLRPMPPARCEFTLTADARGASFVYRTLGGLPGVPAQISLDFPAGTEFSEDGRRWRRLGRGECRFLAARRHAYLRSGQTIVRVGPGAADHAMHSMRDVEPPGEVARLLIPLLTPARHRFSLRLQAP